ncbi:MAG: hypothetical protein V4512_08095 [Pseudomonadota bacterium]
MTQHLEPPKSLLAISFYVIGVIWMLSLFYLYASVGHLRGIFGSLVVPSVIQGIAVPTLIILTGSVVQRISDIHWKLFGEGRLNA